MNKPKLTLYNSLTRKKEIFEPIDQPKNPESKPKVGMYTCGPTIYDFPSIGNWRTYILSDILYRVLIFNGYDVKHVMNMTDVGHLSGDNLGDASQGEDRMSKASQKEGVDAWGIADKYGTDFIESFDDFNMIKPDVMPRATDHVKEQIAMIEALEKKGFTYQVSDGIYFNIGKYEKDGNTYGDLSTLDERIEGERIEPNPNKKDPRDFALWKFFATGQKRHGMEWESKWGTGFPGWHIECSAMSMKHLGEQFDIHVGGEDMRQIHHPNEIAQSEAATGKKPFVKYWVHGAFLQVDGGRMGKSLGNAYTLHDVKEKGFDPIAFRYLTLGTHYRKPLNFTWANFESAQTALHRLRRERSEVSEHTFDDDERAQIKDNKYFAEFLMSINDDLNMPKALAVVWKVFEDDSIDNKTKALLLSEFDEVLGLDIYADGDWGSHAAEIPFKDLPKDVQSLIDQRQKARTDKDFKKADELRDQIEDLGYKVEDSEGGVIVKN